jgi:DNA-directed RNA polymerase specialized sigma24 family protein
MDTTALENLYRSAFPKVAVMVKRYGGDLDTARDLFQDALLILLQKEEAPVHPEAYLLGISKNLCRRLGRQPVIVGLPDELGEASETTSHVSLWRFLRGAGSKCLQLLQAFYYKGQSMEEIADEFDYSSARSATVQKYKCLEKVREQVKHEEVFV